MRRLEVAVGNHGVAVGGGEREVAGDAERERERDHERGVAEVRGHEARGGGPTDAPVRFVRRPDPSRHAKRMRHAKRRAFSRGRFGGSRSRARGSARRLSPETGSRCA